MAGSRRPSLRGPRCTPALMVLAAVVLLVVAGCRRQEAPISLPQTPVLSGQESHALVLVPYLRIHAEPTIEAAVVGHARLAEVLPVRTRTPDGSWVAVVGRWDRGWAPARDLRFFAGEAQAQNAARGMRP